MNTNPTFGEIIKRERLAQKLTQEEVAERIGCHPQYYKNLENDKGNPSIQLFCTIMRTLNISADSYVFPDRHPDNPLYDKIIHLLKLCDPDQLSVILATAEALIKLSSKK